MHGSGSTMIDQPGCARDGSRQNEDSETCQSLRNIQNSAEQALPRMTGGDVTCSMTQF